MLFILKVIAALILLAVVVIGIYILLQGKEEMFFEVTQRTKARLIKRSENKLEFEVELPMHNDGKEEGIILDAFIRVYLPREDDYFEAMLLGPGVKKTMVVKFELVPEHGVTLKQAVEGMPDVDIALFLDCRGRTALYTVKKIITLHKDELQALLA